MIDPHTGEYVTVNNTINIEETSELPKGAVPIDVYSDEFLRMNFSMKETSDNEVSDELRKLYAIENSINKKDMKRRREKDQEVNKSISDYDNNNKETGWIDGIHADENALKEVPASVEDGIIQYFKEMDSRQRELIQKAIENSMPDLYIRRMFVLDYEKMKQFYDSYFS